MIQEAIFKLVEKNDLTFDEAYAVTTEIMRGETTPIQTAAFLAALSTKSTRAETEQEIAGCAQAMRELATKASYDGDVLEIVGTGGDKSGTFNISTTAAFIIAACGVKVAKHGNRAASSKSGTADVQEALGACIHQGPDSTEHMLDEVGMTFFFAPDYHAAMRYVGPIRKELGIRTVFNILGPLTNPISPECFLLGVYDESLVEPLAHVLSTLGVKRAMVVYGYAGLDELSSCCDTLVCELNDEAYRSYVVTPEEFGFKRCEKNDLSGGDAVENAEITRGILDGSITGAKMDTTLMNAGAALYIAQRASSIAEGIELAQKAVSNGSAMKTLEAYIAVSNEVGCDQ